MTVFINGYMKELMGEFSNKLHSKNVQFPGLNSLYSYFLKIKLEI